MRTLAKASFAAAFIVAAQLGMSSTARAEDNSSTVNKAVKLLNTNRNWAFVNKAPVQPTSKLLRSAADAVQNAKGDEEKTAARKKLNELVDKCFDEDMAQRQKELEQLEKRLSQLREQLDRRKTKKQDIVDLQMKVLLNEADGLGFFSSDSRGGDVNSRVPEAAFFTGSGVNAYGLPTVSAVPTTVPPRVIEVAPAAPAASR